ncbi:hypothetical protein STRIP9103_03650 [Streptomyces ipomoeae 91-03]|uniref:Phosphoribosyl transferase domain protein n=1 Tax=Streptomyces ipomoeae 91-03 TaxID=698759 RepID=L1KLE3_9ACTN|nr:hypothetical protein STRIP9103_03650 [Streptomyces ipomoeae 91-03]
MPEPFGLPVVYAAARYGGAVRATLLAHKERGALALAEPLGAALAGAVWAGLGEGWAGVGRGGGGGPEEPVLLVPVPSAPHAVRARGHDPTRRIALVAARVLRRAGVSARVAGVLRQRRVVVDQAGLGSRQRLVNLAGALEVVGGAAPLSLGGGRVVLVDDLMTTGASLAEAARAARTVVRGVGGASGQVGAGGAAEGATRACAVTGSGGPDDGRGGICAAVIAAPPDSF